MLTDCNIEVLPTLHSRAHLRRMRTTLRQTGLPAPQEAPPAVDVLFDLFEFALSPAGLGAVLGLVALGFVWDFVTASDNRTLLGQKRQTSVTLLGQTYSTDEVDAPSRFTIKFSCSEDGFFESPRGGAERVEAGVAYIEEFDDLSGCVALGKALQRTFGKGKLQFQTFEVRGGEWKERPASSYSPAPQARGSAKPEDEQIIADPADTAPGDDGNVLDVGDELDREWKKMMDDAKLLKRKDVGLDGVEVTIITGENACRLCNGRGKRGCSTCATPANLADGNDGRLPSFLTEPSNRGNGAADVDQCPTCSGDRVVPCEWCGGSGTRQKT